MTTRLPRPRDITHLFDHVLAEDPSRELLVTRTGRFSYAEVDRLAARAANALAALGARPGDRVAGCLPNELDVVIAFQAAMRLGAIWVGINRALAPPEQQFLLDDSGATVLLCDGATAEQLIDISRVRVVVVEAGGADSEWTEVLHSADDAPPRVDIDPHAPAGIAYTSGTTGFPKGAVHSQYNLLLPGAMLVHTRGYGPLLRKGDALPLTILNLQVLTLLLVAQAGGCSVIMDRTDPSGVADWIRRERVTLWNGVPPTLLSLAALDEVTPHHLASLEEVWTGGAECPAAIRSAFESKFAVSVCATYGLTEAPTIVSIEPLNEPHVPGSSGRALPHLEISLVDDEVCLATASAGEWANLYRPMLGYWNNPGATEATIPDGVLHTGDLGVVDAEDLLHIRDRKTLVINRGGANVYPAEVERAVLEIAGIVACAVIGIADDRLGERVVGAVEVAPGVAIDAHALTVHCQQKLAKYKVPERWVFVDRFERNSMGKIQRRSLPALFEPDGSS